MGKRHPNPRIVKIHRNYTVEEVPLLFGVHKNTVRAWIKRGLPVIDDKRPIPIIGRDLSAFLQKQRAKNKQPCKLGEMYYLRCRKPKTPALNMVECKPKTDTLGNLFGICPDCGTGMNRSVNLSKLDQVRGQLDIVEAETYRQIKRLMNRGR